MEDVFGYIYSVAVVCAVGGATCAFLPFENEKTEKFVRYILSLVVLLLLISPLVNFFSRDFFSGEEIKKVFLDEIAVLLIENPAVSLTGCLLEALVEKKIRVIFCDAKRNPNSELVPYYNSYDNSRKIKAQICWSYDIKGAVWADIVAEKIRKQADFLNELGSICWLDKG